MRKRFYKWSILATFFGLIVFLLPVSGLALKPGLYIPDLFGDVVYRFDLSKSELSQFYGTRPGEEVDGPFFLKEDEDGNLIISSQIPGTESVIRVSPEGDYIEAIADNLNYSHGMALDSSGNLYVVEFTGAVVKIPSPGVVQTLADGLDVLADAEFDDEGNLYISVSGEIWDGVNYEIVGPPDGKVLKISQAALAAFDGVTPVKVEEIADGLSWPVGLAYRNGQLYVAEYAGWVGGDWDGDEGQIISIDLDTPGFPSTSYFFPISTPVGLAFDEVGNLYVAQGANEQVSMIDDTGSSSSVVVQASAFAASADLGGLIYVRELPVINGIAKTNRYPGQLVRIKGTGFGDRVKSSKVYFNSKRYAATSAQVKSWKNTRIRVYVPDYSCRWFKDKTSKTRKIRVRVGGIDSNIEKIKVKRPGSCD